MGSRDCEREARELEAETLYFFASHYWFAAKNFQRAIACLAKDLAKAHNLIGRETKESQKAFMNYIREEAHAKNLHLAIFGSNPPADVDKIDSFIRALNVDSNLRKGLNSYFIVHYANMEDARSLLRK
ncbi:TPA: hypothetical protein H1005_02330 [archaeon]|uniref:Uncharacterized protein n=1 Tax=Candidatus Naiadarchaeum limnaeum TaxID=2756139 RepID=A0A832V2F3_9ARCH|nr:hypothetical protein [Candidatus Naiadarchaeales archaeon SRR2090153.bin1042]HIK00776.1 hypothetical protein [Candidatus Naiadarchaeum limnaeum]